MTGHRVQLTVRLERQVMQAARHRADEMKRSLSAIVAEAAKESLLSSYRSEREQEILKAVDRNFHALRRFERQLRFEILVLKEMIGVGMRSFFNHTTPIPEATKNAALRSGRERFARYLDVLAANLRSGESILKDLPPAESGEQNPPVASNTDGELTQTTASSSAEADTPHHAKTSPNMATHVDATPISRNRANGQRNRGLFESDGDEN